MTMSNVEVVRRGYQAFNEADMATLTKLFHPQASWHTPGRSPIAGAKKGRDAVFGQFGQYGGGTQGTFKADLKELLVSEDGQIIEGREHFYDLHNWDEFWG